MNTDHDRDALGAVRTLAELAEKESATGDPPDTAAILAGALAPAAPRISWVARSGAAAAVLVAAAGALLLARTPSLPDGPVPTQITALVDSLYSMTDYVHDDLGELLTGRLGAADSYMDDVWQSVVTDIENP